MCVLAFKTDVIFFCSCILIHHELLLKRLKFKFKFFCIFELKFMGLKQGSYMNKSTNSGNTMLLTQTVVDLIVILFMLMVRPGGRNVFIINYEHE